jgi:hypothetical protein
MNLIPEDIYAVKITRAEIGETQSGTPYARLHLQITAEGECANRLITKDLYLSDAAWEKSVATLKKLGFEGDDINAVSKLADTKCVAKIVIKAQTNKDNTVRRRKRRCSLQERSCVGRHRQFGEADGACESGIVR